MYLFYLVFYFVKLYRKLHFFAVLLVSFSSSCILKFLVKLKPTICHLWRAEREAATAWSSSQWKARVLPPVTENTEDSRRHWMPKNYTSFISILIICLQALVDFEKQSAVTWTGLGVSSIHASKQDPHWHLVPLSQVEVTPPPKFLNCSFDIFPTFSWTPVIVLLLRE